MILIAQVFHLIQQWDLVAKWTAEAQAAYAKAAREATAGAQTDPSLGNVMVQRRYNRVAGSLLDYLKKIWKQ